MSAPPTTSGAGWGGAGPYCDDAGLLWAALANDSHCMVSVLDRSAGVVYANTVAERFLGAPPGALAGRSLADSLPPETLRNALHLIGRALASPAPVVSEGYLHDALIRATWRAIPGPGGVRDRVLVVATPPAVAGQSPAAAADVVRNAPPETESIAQLSKRELEILALLGRGMSVPEVAEALHRSARTVESHRLSIGKKVGVRNRSELTRFAIRAGLVTPDQLSPGAHEANGANE